VAILNEKFNVADLLLKHGADINLCPILPQVITSKEPNLMKLVDYLLSHGADPNKPNDQGDTALIAACRQNMTELIKTLLEHKANPDVCFTSSNSSVLHIVAAHGNLELVKLFSEKYPRFLNFTNKFNETPMIVATRYGRETVVEYFLSIGVDYAMASKFAPNPYIIALFIEATVKKQMSETKEQRKEARKRKREQKSNPTIVVENPKEEQGNMEYALGSVIDQKNSNDQNENQHEKRRITLSGEVHYKNDNEDVEMSTKSQEKINFAIPENQLQKSKLQNGIDNKSNSRNGMELENPSKTTSNKKQIEDEIEIRVGENEKDEFVTILAD